MSDKTLLQTIWGEVNPYDGFSYRRFRPDMQGWNSQHVFLSDTLRTSKPAIVVEVGVWKGGSKIHMAETARSLGIDTRIISVDTWLGSWEHWQQPDWFPELLFQNGYPCLYYTFLTNICENDVEDYVIPLPLDSANAAFVLDHKGIRPDVIHIDAGHDYDAVAGDLKRWWSLLAPGGTMIADDYDIDGRVWPSVRQAVDDFLVVTPHEKFEAVPYKCRFDKPI